MKDETTTKPRELSALELRLKAIRAAGYHIEVKHLRVDQVQLASIEHHHEGNARDWTHVMLTRQEFAALDQRGASPLSGRGGATFVRIIPSGPGGLVPDAAVEGRAVCRFTDTFSRTRGLTIALGRAVGAAQRAGFNVE